MRPSSREKQKLRIQWKHVNRLPNRVIFVWPWNENARAKQKQQTNGNRAIWLVCRTDTNASGVKQTHGWKTSCPKNSLEINRYLALTSYCNTIGQSNNALSIFGFSMFWSFHPLADKTNNEYRNHYSRSYENRSTLRESFNRWFVPRYKTATRAKLIELLIHYLRMETLKTHPYWAAHTYLAHIWEYTTPTTTPPPRLTGILTQWVMIAARIFTKVHELHLSGPISLIFFKVLPSSQGKIKTMFTCIFSFSRVGWGLELEAMKVYYGRCANGQLSTLTECNFIESFIWQCWKWDLNPPLKSQEIDENGLLE